MKRVLLAILLLAVIVLPDFSYGQTNRPYLSDRTVIKDIGRDLYNSLKPGERAQLSPRPLWLIDDPRPFSRPFRFNSENSPTRIVYLSEGFLKLANNVAHAKAIDRGEPGFFDQYIAQLGQEVQNTNRILPVLPVFTESRYWTDDILNEQAGYFNQIVGVCAAIDLAHHYLGHYEKQENRLRDSAIDPNTMAGVCSVAQWESALNAGTANALDCGFAFDGIKAFYECLEKLPRRPGWTMYFLPVKVNVAKIKKELTATESRFFGQNK